MSKYFVTPKGWGTGGLIHSITCYKVRMNYYTITSKDNKQYSILAYLIKQYNNRTDYYSKNKLIITDNTITIKDDIQYTFTNKELLKQILEETSSGRR